MTKDLPLESLESLDALQSRLSVLIGMEKQVEDEMAALLKSQQDQTAIHEAFNLVAYIS
jgi:hypothetical protein